MRSAIDLSGAESFAEPFSHCFASSALGERIAAETLAWFENGAPWTLTVANFYEQYEFSLDEAELPPPLEPLRDESTLSNLRREMHRLFDARLLEGRIEITAHKLVLGQRIRIHNDYIPNQETHRLLIQLNRGWSEKNGGMLLLFRGPASEDLSRIVHPLHRTALAFEVSPRSHHAVLPVTAGDRFTLVYSFISAT